jgi:hypothetical protein
MQAMPYADASQREIVTQPKRPPWPAAELGNGEGEGFGPPNMWRVSLPQAPPPSLLWAILPGLFGVLGFVAACAGLALQALPAGIGIALMTCSGAAYVLALIVGSRSSQSAPAKRRG